MEYTSLGSLKAAKALDRGEEVPDLDDLPVQSHEEWIFLNRNNIDVMFLREIDEALERIEDASYSTCMECDEPISALDIAHQVEVLTLVQSLSHARGRSVVVVLHDLNMAARYCDHIVALKSGRLVSDGTPHDLMTPDRLLDIYGARMEVMTRADGSPVALPV